MDPSHHLSLCWLPLKAGNLLTPSAWALSSRPLSYPLPYCKEGLVTLTRRTSAQAVPVCVRVLTAPPTLYIKSHCRLNIKDVKQVRSTLGILGYQRPFIKNAAIVRPLHNLTKKDASFEWTQECTDALEQLIQAVALEPVLYQPDFTKQFKLEVDMSLFAVGAVLFQRDEEGQRRPISYFSQVLNPTERKYDIWDREFLTMIRGLKHNCHLLVGLPHKVIILMDHENLAHYHHLQKIN